MLQRSVSAAISCYRWVCLLLTTHLNMTPTTEWLENITYDELQVGQSARLLRTLSMADIQAFAAVSGDTNPAHLNSDYANDTLFHGVIAHGMWGGALISALLGTQFPGPGTIYVSQDLHFTRPVRVGDTLTVTVTVRAKDPDKKVVEMDCLIQNQHGVQVLAGGGVFQGVRALGVDLCARAKCSERGFVKAANDELAFAGVGDDVTHGKDA